MASTTKRSVNDDAAIRPQDELYDEGALIPLVDDPVTLDGGKMNLELSAAVHDRVLERERKETCRIAVGMLGGSLAMIAFGLAMGFAVKKLNTTEKVSEPWTTISGVVGWIYFAAWSVSFYPQAWMNFRRKSVIGLSFDYQLYNLLGFTAYGIFNCSLFFVRSIKDEYKERHDGNGNPVQANDVFFALHAVVLTAITIFQILIYERGNQKLSRFAIGFSTAATFGAILYAVFVWAKVNHSSPSSSWLGLLYYLSYIKLGVTLIKYAPQAIMNWRRKTTDGFNIYNVLMDFTGGALSVVQLLMDCALAGDWSGISGDPVKFGLGLMSMVFDTIFMVQHFLLYRARNRLYWRARYALVESEGDEQEHIRALLLSDALAANYRGKVDVSDSSSEPLLQKMDTADQLA